MAIFSVRGTQVKGIAACVPSAKEYNRDYDWISEAERNLLIKTTGISSRHIAGKGTTTTDLAVPAAELLIRSLGWDKNEIDLLVLVTQSRDYFLPSSGVILQDRIGLPHTCASFDIGLGCSGYVYGMSVVASMLQTGGFRKAILIAGDISTVSLNYKDKSAYPLFGDAVTATGIEFNPGGEASDFNLQSDGGGFEAIIIQDGCVRNPPSDESHIEHEVEKGIIRSRKNLWLNGMDIFNFSVREAPKNITALMNFNGTTEKDYDFFVMHQANLLMNETIRKKLKIPAEKTPYSLKDYGNTSSASIPLTILTQCAEAAQQPRRWLLSGFGVGLSWASCSLFTDKIICPPVLEL
ncbi:MAG TPA: ketoacyl-ACP synthase III [Bacteroidia bacterium]|nr:ketoacyl-ACP synthase III [Bacteroidia bacterium]